LQSYKKAFSQRSFHDGWERLHIAYRARQRRTVSTLPGHASQADATGFRHLWKLTTCELKRAQTHSTLLIRNANERVAQFLLEMVSRESNATKIDLPMSRQDIADYLGLTVETVSRVLGGFEAADVIARPTARHVVVRDRAKLKRFDRVSNPPRPPVRLNAAHVRYIQSLPTRCRLMSAVPQ
jgi:hypothetical protein